MAEDYVFDRRTENMVADFRGLPRANKRGRIRKAQEAGDLIDKLLEKFKVTTPRPEAEIQHQWDYVVGQYNIDRCQPLRVQNDVLMIGCEHPTLARELQMNKRMILKRVKAVCPSIRDVRFVAS